MEQIPHIWKVQIPPKLLPRLDFLQTTIKHAVCGFSSEFQKQGEITPVFHCLMEVTQPPSIFIFSGHLLDRTNVSKLLKIPDHMLHDIEMIEYPLRDFETALSSTKFIETPYASVACLQVEGKKRLFDGQTKLELSDVSRCFIERLKPIISDEKMEMLYVVEFNFIDETDELECLNQMEELLDMYDYCDKEFLRSRIFFERENELPARICRNMERHILERVSKVIGQIEDERSSYQEAMALISREDFQTDILSRSLKSLGDHLKNSLSIASGEHGMAKVEFLAESLSKLIDSTMVDESSNILLGICCNTLIQKRDIYKINEIFQEDLHCHEVPFAIRSTMEEYLISNDLKCMTCDQTFLDLLNQKIINAALPSFKNRWHKATSHLDDKANIGTKFTVALKSVYDKVKQRLKEKVPHHLQVQAARMKNVTGISVTDQTLNVYVTAGCFQNEESKEMVRRKFQDEVRQVNFEQISKVNIQKKNFDLNLFQIKSGSPIGFPNPKMSNRYRYGTIGAIATEAKIEKYAITCSHVAEPGMLMYDRCGDEIGKATTELSITSSDEAFGNFLDFTAVHTFLPTERKFKSLNAEVEHASVEVFDGDFEELEGKELFFHGATSQNEKKVKYLTNISFDGSRNSLLHRRSKDKIPGQTMVGMDVLEAVSQDEPTPGDSGSLICYCDNDTLYGVFLFVGKNEDDGTFACCRVAEGLDILAGRGFTLEL